MGIDASMYVRTKRALDPADVRRISARLVEAFGTEPFTLYLPDGTYSWGGEHFSTPRHALIIMQGEVPDGIDPGGSLVAVALSGHFYGIGYERGNLPELMAIVRWLRANFSPCEIYYGGDQQVSRFDLEAQVELWDHFLGPRGRSYFQRPIRAGGRAPLCAFCGGKPMSSYGGSNDLEFVVCNGCGFEGDLRPNGMVTQRMRSTMGTRGPLVPRERLTDALLAAVAASTLDETTIVSARLESERGVDHVSMTLRTDWSALSEDEREAAYERALELLSKRVRRI